MNRKIFLILIVGMLVSFITIQAQTATQPTAGDGSEGNPWQIENLEHLLWLAETNSAWAQYSIQTADIDASETSTWFDGKGFLPIALGSNFNGSYDGQNHTIDALFINRQTDYIGLFSVINNSIYFVKNIILTNVDISGRWSIGALVGVMNNGNIDNCHSSGNITTASNGGVMGGLIGVNISSSTGLITNSSSSADVTGQAGGGDCYGGFIGRYYEASGTISNCYSTGTVSGISYVGGFVGLKYQGSSSIVNCYSTGSVTLGTGGSCGGFVGYHSGGNGISNCYSIGLVTGSSNTGGFVGYNDNVIQNCFWDIETSGQATSPAGGIGKTTAEMHTLCTYIDGTDASWDFVIETINGTDNYWGMNANENAGYPFLEWQGYEHTESCCGFFDFENPEITSTPNNETIEADVNCEASLPTYTVTATDDCDSDLDVTQDPLAGTTITGYSNTVTLTVTDDAGNYTQTAFFVDVIDVTAPTITCVDNQTIDLTQGETSYTVAGSEFDPTAEDNCNGVTVLNDQNDTETLADKEFTAGTYTITWTATDVRGNDETCEFVLTVNAFVAVSELSELGISIYPNPSTGIFNINMTTEHAPLNIEITNISGKIIKQFNNETIQKIDLSENANGVYFIKFQNNETVKTLKIIKE